MEFGLEDRAGITRPGGTLFRVVGIEGNHLLETDRSSCLAVDQIHSDGHAHPIPVVSEVTYRAQLVSAAFDEFRLSFSQDVSGETDANAAQHWERAARTDSIATRGERFLCANAAQDNMLSCQIRSPYGDAYALVIYCDAQTCEMPAMGFDDRIIVSARWRRGTDDPEALGPEIIENVQRLHDFLLEQS